jgi:hypothetical protein
MSNDSNGGAGCIDAFGLLLAAPFPDERHGEVNAYRIDVVVQYFAGQDPENGE